MSRWGFVSQPVAIIGRRVRRQRDRGLEEALAALVLSAGAAGAGLVAADSPAADGDLFRTLLIRGRLRIPGRFRGGHSVSPALIGPPMNAGERRSLISKDGTPRVEGVSFRNPLQSLGGRSGGRGDRGLVEAAAALVLFAGAAGAGLVAADFLAANGDLFHTLLIRRRLRVLRGLRGGLGPGAISFRKPLIQLEIVERADRILVAEVDVLGDLEALEALEFAQVGAVGAFEAEVVAPKEGGLLGGLGMGEGVDAADALHHHVFEFQAAVHVPGGVDEALEGVFLEVADGLEGVEEVVVEGLVVRAVFVGDDGLEAGEAVFQGIARRRGFALGGGGSTLVCHGRRIPFR